MLIGAEQVTSVTGRFVTIAKIRVGRENALLLPYSHIQCVPCSEIKCSNSIDEKHQYCNLIRYYCINHFKLHALVQPSIIYD